MAEPGRTQLQMMLVQQAGQGALPLSILPDTSFLPFIRTVEQLAVDERLAPVMVYWSKSTAARYIPSGPRFRELLKDAFCVAIFSEDKEETPEDWCFLIESRGLCLIVYGVQTLESPEGNKYQCAGSMDPQIVRQAFNSLLPTWQQVNLAESNRLEDARVNLGPCGSAPPYVQRIRSAWPIIKAAPIASNMILQPTDLNLSKDETFQQNISNLFSESGKIQPIALDPGMKFLPISPPRIPQAPPIPIQQALSLLQGIDANVTASTIPSQEFEIDDIESDGESNRRLQPLVDDPEASEALVTSTASASADGANGTGAAVFPVAAQSIISDIIGQLRHSNDLSSILQFAIETLTTVVGAERGLIWQVVGDQLAVTNEFAMSGHTCFAGNQLGSQESTAIVLEFLSRFPDESGAGVISIPDTSQDTNLHKMSPTLSSLIELGDVRARLMVQLRSRGIFSGFLELQQCGKIRDWSREDAVILQCVAEMLSVVVQQSFDQSKIEMDAKEMKLINEIASLFRESRGQTSQESLVKSVVLVAEHMGFTHSQIYLYNQEEKELVPQIHDGNNTAVSLSTKDDPFVAVFDSGRGKIVNAEFTRKGDPFFGHDMALVLPLVSEGERLGVVGIWQRLPNKPQFRPQDRELGLTIAGHLSNVIRADQAIQQIRADQARADLINKVSNEIRQSLKEVDQITGTLVGALQEYFDLGSCVVSLFDQQTEQYVHSKTAGPLTPPKVPLDSRDRNGSDEVEELNFGEQLFQCMRQELSEGQTIFLTAHEIKNNLAYKDIVVPPTFKSATLVPLIHAGNYKAALAMVSCERQRPIGEKDMKMVADLADRTAVVVSHAELFRQVEQQAVTDPMTGLFNRRYFQEQLAKEIDRYQRFGHAFSFIIVDLDYLKKINDTLGHHAGDAAIKHIANITKKSVRDVDTVGRFGGEEFVVLLPETELQPARMVAERICAAIREREIDEDIGTVTASIGLATFPYDAQDREKLFELADQALFLAKHRGRNQVCSVAEDLIPSIAEGNAPPMQIERMPVIKAQDHGIVDLAMVSEKGILGVFAQIMQAVEKKDAYSEERSPKAYGYASKIAQALHLSKEEAEVVSLAAVLSNLGKISIPEDVLQKPGPLTEEEMAMVKRAPMIGAKLLEPAKLLHRVGQIIEAFHEHWDGSGYPKGMKENDIPPGSRIIAIVDAYTSMTSDRPYRKALTKNEAVKILQDGAGKEWDPRLVKIFISLINKEK
ncbi:MAG TPA: diguanylate cyclase [Drouetiella sp.]